MQSTPFEEGLVFVEDFATAAVFAVVRRARVVFNAKRGHMCFLYIEGKARDAKIAKLQYALESLNIYHLLQSNVPYFSGR